MTRHNAQSRNMKKILKQHKRKNEKNQKKCINKTDNYEKNQYYTNAATTITTTMMNCDSFIAILISSYIAQFIIVVLRYLSVYFFGNTIIQYIFALINLCVNSVSFFLSISDDPYRTYNNKCKFYDKYVDRYIINDQNRNVIYNLVSTFTIYMFGFNDIYNSFGIIVTTLFSIIYYNNVTYTDKLIYIATFGAYYITMILNMPYHIFIMLVIFLYYNVLFNVYNDLKCIVYKKIEKM